MIQIYHNPRCSKSRQTLRILEEETNEFQLIDYLNNPPSYNELKSILSKLRMKPKELIRTNEGVYKENYKGKDLSDDEWINAMVANPILIERPIVVKDNRAVLGRPPENIHELI